LNGEAGWINANGEIKDMSKDQVASERINHRAGAIASLIPLKNKEFTVKAAGAGKVGDKEAIVVEVSRKDYPTVKLYFDKKTELLIRSELKSKASDLEFKEVAMEMNFSNYKEVEGCKMPHTMSLKRDGKKFVEADLSDLKSGHVDSKIFAKPAKN